MLFRSGSLFSVFALIGAATLTWVAIEQKREIESIRIKVEAMQLQLQSTTAANKRIELGVGFGVGAAAIGNLTPQVPVVKAGPDSGNAKFTNEYLISPDAVMKAGVGLVSPGIAQSALLSPSANTGVPAKLERPPQQAAFLQVIREAHLRNMQAQPPTPEVSLSPFGQR